MLQVLSWFLEMEMKSCCLTDAERARFPEGLAWAGQL